jgi:hypothetical protein
MIIKKLIIGTICILLLVGMYNRIAISGEEAATSPVKGSTEKVIKLVEEYKEYMATPKATFLYFCSPCHGKFGNGKGIYFTIDLKPTPRDLTDVEYMAALTDDYLLNFISKGSAVMEKSDLCPPWGGSFDEDKIKGIIGYIRSLAIAETKEEEVPAEEEEVAVEGEGGESEEGEEDEKKEEEVKVSVGEQKRGGSKTLMWLVLIVLCAVFVYAAKNEWKKLGMEEASKK